MSFLVRFTEEAADDLTRLYAFAAESDPAAAYRALEVIEKAWVMLEQFSFSCRKADGGDPFLREVIIPCGATGYVALFDIEADNMVTVLAVRHQLEDDYH